jgi:hypothetical protein
MLNGRPILLHIYISMGNHFRHDFCGSFIFHFIFACRPVTPNGRSFLRATYDGRVDRENSTTGTTIQCNAIPYDTNPIRLPSLIFTQGASLCLYTANLYHVTNPCHIYHIRSHQQTLWVPMRLLRLDS